MHVCDSSHVKVKVKDSEFHMDFAARIKDLRRVGTIETENTRKLIESLDTVDDFELTALRVKNPKKTRALLGGAMGAYGQGTYGAH